MEYSPLLHTIRYLIHAMAIVSVPVEATTATRTGAAIAPVNDVAYRLIDYFTLELVLLGGLILLAFVLIARRPKAR
jgi:hypothetical protein